jgi:hypothetical protein
MQGLSFSNEWDIITRNQLFKVSTKTISDGMAFSSSVNSRYPACNHSGSHHMVLECRRNIPENKRENIPTRYPPEKPIIKQGNSRFPDKNQVMKNNDT